MPATEVGTKRSKKKSAAVADDSPKKIKPDVSKIRVLIKGNYTGALIGKGGENFKRLREEYGVKITGLSSRAPERVLQLDGARDKCFKILEGLIPSCPEAPFTSQGIRCPVEMNILVNTEILGLIIGKGGAKVKEISEQNGGHLKIYSECLPNSNERVVAIGGDTESIVMSTLDTVLSVLDNTNIKSQTLYYNPSNITPSQINGQLSQQTTLLTTAATIAAQDVELASGMDIAQLLIASKDLKKINPTDPTYDFGKVITVTTLTVTNEMCGAIIGKGGMNVRNIRMSSGAKVDFTQGDSENKTERVVTLTGTQDQIQIAQQLMGQYVRTSTNVAAAVSI